MEKELFIWSTLEDVDFCTPQFYDCRLLKDIGKYQKGMIMSCILMNYQKGEMIFFDEEGNELQKFRLTFNVEAQCNE